MTDNEIISALEHCINRDCGGCKFVTGCKSLLLREALDFINRQRAKNKALQMDNAQLQSDIVNANMNLEHAQAEIERLQKAYIKEQECFSTQSLENERLKVENERLKGWQDLLKAEKHSLIKAEAIKEFFERMKQLHVTVAFPDGELKTTEEMKEWANKVLKRVSVALNDIKEELLKEWGEG